MNNKYKQNLACLSESMHKNSRKSYSLGSV